MRSAIKSLSSLSSLLIIVITVSKRLAHYHIVLSILITVTIELKFVWLASIVSTPMKLHESAKMHGKCVTATQSCRTDPFLVVLRLINEHKKGYGWRGGKAGMQGIQARELKRKTGDKQKDTSTTQHQTRTGTTEKLWDK